MPIPLMALSRKRKPNLQPDFCARTDEPLSNKQLQREKQKGILGFREVVDDEDERRDAMLLK
jgi:hypothetical protein